MRTQTADKMRHVVIRWNGGESQSAIARSMGVTPQYVNSLLRAARWPTDVMERERQRLDIPEVTR